MPVHYVEQLLEPVLVLVTSEASVAAMEGQEVGLDAHSVSPGLRFC